MSGLRRVALGGLLAMSALLPMVIPSSAGAAAPAANESMRVIKPDAAPNLAAVSIPGRYTLVILSPPFGECAPCDQLWAQLSETKDLKIDVVKVLIDDELPKPKVFAEARRLIYSSMDLAEGSEISYPLGVMLDPNGVVLQATFGKPRIDKKLKEVFAALAQTGPAAPASTTGPQATGPVQGVAAVVPRTSSFDLKLAAAALGIGAVVGGVSMVAASGARLEKERRLGQYPYDCDASCRGDAVQSSVTREKNLNDINLAGWIMTGAGALIAAEAAAFMIYERAGRAGTVGVVGRVGTTGVAVALEGKF